MEFIRNKKVKIILILEVLACIITTFIAVFLAGGTEGKRMMPEDFFPVAGTYVDSKQGYFIDESADYQGCFTCGPYKPLDKGIYTVTIFYDTDTDENTCYAFSESARYFYGSIKSDKNILKSGLSSKSFKIWINKDVEDFEIRTDYNGKGSLLVKEVHIEKSNTTYALGIIKLISIFCLINLICYLYFIKRQGKLTNDKVCLGIGLAGIVILAAYPLLYDFLIYGTDLRFHLMRIDGVKEAIRTGQIPVKIAPLWLNGYGFAVSAFYGNLFLYIPAALRLVGATLQDSYKWYCFIVILFGCWSSYYCMKGLFESRRIGFAGSLLFTLSPYNIAMLYSGWTGAFTAYAFLPLIFCGGYRLFRGEKWKNAWIPMTIGFTGIIQSHILTCEMVGIFMIICCIINIRKVFKKDVFFILLKTVIMTILINAWFLIPFLDYMGGNFNIRSDRTSDMYNIQGNGIPLANLFSLYHNTVQGSGTRIPPYSIGIALLAGSIFSLYYFYQKEHDDKKKRESLICLGIGMLAVWMCTNLFPWDKLAILLGPLSSLVVNIEYPWRFICMANIFLIAAVCGALARCNRTKQEKCTQWAVISIMIGTTFLAVNDEYSYMLEKTGVIRAYDMEAMDNYDYKTGWGIQEYLPVGTDLTLLNREMPLADENITISDYSKDGVNIEITCTNMGENPGKIEMPLINYPGYKAIDKGSGKELKIENSDNNVMQVVIPAGYQGGVKVKFVGKKYWKLSYFVSVITIIGLIIAAIRKKEKK